MKTPIAWTIGGSDSGGGAGIQADLKTMAAFGVHGCSAITALTAQNTRAVAGIHPVPGEFLGQQLDALQDDLCADAIKLGMLHSEEIITTVADRTRGLGAPVVCDPVLVSTSGALLLEKPALRALKTRLLPEAALITPNLPEAFALLQEDAEIRLTEKLLQDDDLADATIEHAAGTLVKLGARAVLLKGGHRGGDFSQDFFTDGRQSWWLTSPRHHLPSCHGSGCTLSAAIASSLALGYPLLDALVLGKAFVNQALRLWRPVGGGHQPLRHETLQLLPDDLPWATRTAREGRERLAFKRDDHVGFYPIVARAANMDPLLSAGVSTIQLRVKDLQGEQLREEIAAAIASARKAGCRLYVNDHWREALELGAYGVHLGQSDLDGADCLRICEAGVRLGVSTHSHFEVARALSLRPSYIAIGPIHETTTKKMPWTPQGLSGFKYWRQLLEYPLVAIGGMFLENAAPFIDAGADGIAVVRDVECADPVKRCRQWLQLLPTPSRVG